MESNDKLEQLLKQMYANETLHDDDIDTSDIIDEEWTKFEAEHFRGEKPEVRGERSSFARLLPKGRKKPEVRSERIPWRKIAAIFIGVLMLSGIAYATIHFVQSNSHSKQEEQTVVTANSQCSTVSAQQAEQDSTLRKPIVYEDVELVTILDDMATFYQLEPVYKKEAGKHIRLYFTWDKKQTIDDIIDTFNKFERIHITRYDKILIVE